MKRIVLLCVVMIVTAMLTGCNSHPQNINTENDTGHAVMGLDYRDFRKASTTMIKSLFASRRLTKPGGGMYVMCPGRIVNDTMQEIDTDQLMADIEEELLNSGKITMTSAVGIDGAKDSMVFKARELRKSDEFNQKNVAGKGELAAPELSISGKILQRNIAYEKSVDQIEYWFRLQITNIKNGTVIWTKKEMLGKRGSSKSVSW